MRSSRRRRADGGPRLRRGGDVSGLRLRQALLAVVAATTILALGSPSNAQSEPALSFVVPLQEPVPLELSTDDSATGGRLARLNVMLRDNIEVTTSGWTPEASARPRRATIAVGGPR